MKTEKERQRQTDREKEKETKGESGRQVDDRIIRKNDVERSSHGKKKEKRSHRGRKRGRGIGARYVSIDEEG